jgi:hypothetical protein
MLVLRFLFPSPRSLCQGYRGGQKIAHKYQLEVIKRFVRAAFGATTHTYCYSRVSLLHSLRPQLMASGTASAHCPLQCKRSNPRDIGDALLA